MAHAFTYTEPGGKLELSTEELLQSPELGIIRDVCLTTILHPAVPGSTGFGCSCMPSS